MTVTPPDIEQTVNILMRLKENYEKHHNVKYTAQAVRACAELADRFIPERCLPDKAIDAMDETGSMVRLEHDILHGNQAQTPVDITAEDVATVISRMSGIPVNKVAETEGLRLMKMKDRLKERIIGQDQAIDTVVRAIQRNRAGIKDPSRPVGTFLFFGPTGVGKTHLAKSLAENLFGSADNLIRIDMSEYMEKFTVSRLIGAPPGYVGYDNGGQLCEMVRRKPYSVVLLDEIEKAHPDIFNILLQILDEGRLTDNTGKTVSFRNTILIMTSNAGSREADEYGSGIGFSLKPETAEHNRKNILEKAVRRIFPPEFLNRVDEQVFFNRLTKDDIGKIIGIELDRLKQRILHEGYRLNVTPAAKRIITEAGYDPKFGARPLKRAIQRLVEDPVSELIISERAIGASRTGAEIIRVGASPDRKGTSVSLSGPASGMGDIKKFEIEILDHVYEEEIG